MRIGLPRYSWIASLAAAWGLTLTSLGWAQDRTPRGLPAASRPAVKGAVGRPAAVSPAEDANRLMEIQVEQAWLADPVTFPYFLRAKAVGGRLQVEGGVPNRTVREHALSLAQLNSSIAVVDGMRENAALLVRPGAAVAPEKLRSSAELALKKALPASAGKLGLECGADGKIVVLGNVGSMEEKHLVSQCLRRQIGCTHVVNAAEVGGTHIAASAPHSEPFLPAPRTPAGKGREFTPEIMPVQAREPVREAPPVSPAPTGKKTGPFGGFFSRMFGKKTDEAPTVTDDPLPPRFPTGKGKEPRITTAPQPLPKGPSWGPPLPKGPAVPGKTVSNPGGPHESSGVVVMPGPGEGVKKTKPLAPNQVKNRVESLFAKNRPVIVHEGGTKLKIELTVRNVEEIDMLAGRLLSLPELEAYNPELSFKIAEPGKK